MLFSFGVFRTAMLAEPAVTDIEEVVGLIQGQKSEVRSQKSESIGVIADI